MCNTPEKQPRPQVTITLHPAMLEVIDRKLCMMWHTSRSQAIQRIIVEWLEEHNPPQQTNSEETE